MPAITTEVKGPNFSWLSVSGRKSLPLVGADNWVQGVVFSVGLLMWKQWHTLIIFSLCWQYGPCVRSHILEGREESNIFWTSAICQTLYQLFLQMLFYVILKTTLWRKNCTTLPFCCCCFKQGRDLKHQGGTDTCLKSHSLLVILNPDCLTAKSMFFLLRNVAALKLHLVLGRKLEFSHSWHSIFKLLMSSCLSLSLCFFFLPAISLFIPWEILTQSEGPALTEVSLCFPWPHFSIGGGRGENATSSLKA